MKKDLGGREHPEGDSRVAWVSTVPVTVGASGKVFREKQSATHDMKDFVGSTFILPSIIVIIRTTEIYLNLSPEEVIREFREKW